MTEACIFDLDGCLAHSSGRNYFDWSRVLEDDCDPVISDLCRLMHKQGKRIIVVTGRDEVCRDATMAWLEKHAIPYDLLLMRPQNSIKKDYEVKQMLYHEHIRNKYDIWFVVEDRPCCVRMYQFLGLKVFNVGLGNEF